MNDTKYVLTDEMKQDRTVFDTLKKMDTNTLAIYIHSWQTENKTVEEIKDLLNSTYEIIKEEMGVEE